MANAQTTWPPAPAVKSTLNTADHNDTFSLSLGTTSELFSIQYPSQPLQIN